MRRTLVIAGLWVILGLPSAYAHPPDQISATPVGFVPSVVNVAPGEQLLFQNSDSVAHRLVTDEAVCGESTPAVACDSGLVPAGGVVAIRFASYGGAQPRLMSFYEPGHAPFGSIPDPRWRGTFVLEKVGPFNYGHGRQPIARASLSTGGIEGNGPSGSTEFAPAVSSEGRYVSFASTASNLVPGDSNNYSDVFLRDLWTGVTTRVSVDPLGRQATRESTQSSISGDGRFVAFQSLASNLLLGAVDQNLVSDIFVRDVSSGTTTRVSVSSADVEANGSSLYPSISGDGRYVAFSSDATNLVPGDSNGKTDIFLRDRDADADGLFDEPGAATTERLSVGAAGQSTGDSHAPAISADGTRVAFHSFASDLLAGDTNGVADVFLRDRGAGTTTRLSVDSTGAQATGPSIYPVVSGNGSVVAFESLAPNLVAGDTNVSWDVFVRAVGAGSTIRVSVGPGGVEGNGVSVLPAISADGSVVAFESYATNLVSGDTNGARDIFVRNVGLGFTVRATKGALTPEPDGPTFWPALSADGHTVVFSSAAANLVTADANSVSDVFASALEAFCADGAPEDGPLSEPTNEFEPATGPGELLVNRANCEFVVPHGL